MRKLASIQKILKLMPIEGRDRIELAQIMGWNVIVKKDEFRENDACVFMEIDSLLPKERQWANFMEKNKYRVKTMRMGGVLSQGLALPLHEFRELDNMELEEGQDVTELLGVVKYEPPEDNRTGTNQIKMHSMGAFPTHLIPKTDELRIQSAMYMLADLRGKPYYVTTKLDGTSATFVKTSEDGLIVCSRNWRVKQEESQIHWDMVKKYNLENMPNGYAIQGEIVGPGIQKNPLKLSETELYIFNIYYIEEREYADFDDWNNIKWIFNENGCYIQTVPVEGIGDNFQCDLQQLLERAQGQYWNGGHKEGIVIRPRTEQKNSKYERLSFKCINNDYLLKK